MFKQSSTYRSSGENIAERVVASKIANVDELFDAWLKKMAAQPPQCCKLHPRVRLVFDRAASWFRASKRRDTVEDRYYGDPDSIVPGTFQFWAAFRCPACRCVYARCPREFHETNFGTFETSSPERKRSLKLAREFSAQVNQSKCGFALFVGLPGVGKTRLACNIVGALEDRTSLYARQGELTCELRASYGRKDIFIHSRRRATEDESDEDEEPTLLALLKDAPFLVLDEIGCTALANDDRLLMDEMLKHRFDERQPTILISNLPVDNLREFLGDAVFDRIRHASGGGKFILQFKGESYRRTSGDAYLSGLP